MCAEPLCPPCAAALYCLQALLRCHIAFAHTAVTLHRAAVHVWARFDRLKSGRGRHCSMLQADAFQRLYPDKYLTKFIEQGVRPDGRPLSLARSVPWPCLRR